MKIEVWSDFACPFCYIGSRLLQKAIKEISFQENIYIRLKSFELDPQAKKINNESLHESLAKKYNISLQEAVEINKDINKQANEVGLHLNFHKTKQTNTFDAHRLVKYAERFNQEEELSELLFNAYFSKGINISDHGELLHIAEKVGLNREDTNEFLQTCKYTNRVREDEELAGELGIHTVPFFVFNEKYALSGVQPSEVFIEVLMEVWEEEKNDPHNKFSAKRKKTTYCCGDGECL